MKVLRFTNLPTPDVAEHLGFPKLMSGRCYNRDYARRRFAASNVAAFLKQIYATL